ncbi:MAG: hypothetical protein Q4E67_05505 [Planctomycetia bacterium]|nr:hypothetical protein [Planctomycetia bacterium]
MNRSFGYWLGGFFLLFGGMCGVLGAQKGVSSKNIRLEIFCDGPLQPIAAQQWGAALQSTGFSGVQLRGGNEEDVLDLRKISEGEYHALGMLTKEETLLLPGGKKFSRRQLGEIRPYLVGLLEERERLEEEQALEAEKARLWEKVLEKLSPAVGVETKNVERRKVLREISQKLKGNVHVPMSIRDVLEKEDCVREELQTVSRGTAMAYVLRYIGYCAVLTKKPSGEMELVWTPSEKITSEEILPVGYPLERMPREMFESFRANVDGALLSVVLDALSQRLQIPFLYDYNSMAAEGIEISEVSVKLNPMKITYDRLLDTLLSQARLKKEVRMDEAGQPFLWITTQ